MLCIPKDEKRRALYREPARGARQNLTVYTANHLASGHLPVLKVGLEWLDVDTKCEKRKQKREKRKGTAMRDEDHIEANLWMKSIIKQGVIMGG